MPIALPTERLLLDLWESGLEAPPAVRTAELLAFAAPDAGVGAFANLPLGSRERCLLELRRALIGPRLTALASCPRCGERHDVECNLDQVLTEFREPPPPTLVVRHEEFTVTVRPVTCGDLEAAATAPDVKARVGELLARCVVAARRGDESCNAQALPEAACATIGEALSAVDPLADLTFDLACTACGERWSAALDAATYLWQEIQTWAQRLLRDVHWLASAYGWTEADVLRLSPWRRAAYVSLSGH